MSKTKKCPQGHMFDSQIYKDCPYCPNPATIEPKDNPTVNINGTEENPTVVEHQNASGPVTKIFGAGDTSNGRKLLGVLISYDIDPLGSVFHLYEGKNIIGSSPACNIHIALDDLISGQHMTILCRGGYVKFKDDFSTNGTKINDTDQEEGVLEDRDLIQIGSTRLHFLLAPIA